MKKIIPILFALLALCSCSAQIHTPVINTEFDVMAVYKAGDFSYTCQIKRQNNIVTITSLSGYAKGTSISFDGKDVTFVHDDMKKTVSAEILNSDNPAMMVYRVFEYIEKNENLDVKKVDNTYQYTGKTSFGNFVFEQKEDNSFSKLTFTDKGVEITFTS